MTAVRHLTSLTGSVAFLLLGTLLVAESTELISGRWRHELASTVERVASPSLAAWQSALIGAGLALVAVVLIAAEFMRPPKGTHIMHPVHDSGSGRTRISGRAAIHAASAALDDIDGIVDIDATITKTTMTLTVRVDDRCVITDIEAQVRERLDHEFWINLGLADFGVNVMITHHPKPPRVR